MKYYLVGIKGAGMSALALALKNIGEMVIGSDNEQYYFTEDKLNENKIPIFNFSEHNIEKYSNYIFIISYAYDEYNNEEVKKIIEKNMKYFYYSDFINYYFNNIKIGVSGTHGKTTTSTMIKEMFKNDNISYIIGDGNGKGTINSKYLIFEACEYKYHFINYDYDYLVINNIDYDHPDYYNNIEEVKTAFKMVSKKTKCLIVNNDDEYARKIKHSCKYSFGIKNNSYVTGKILLKNEQGYKIKVNVKEKEYYFNLPLYGEHMIYNFLASFTIYYLTHNKYKNIENYINQIFKNYKNPKRRMEQINLKNGNIIIDDYAHHPKEIESTYQSIKHKYKDYDITIIFQPHTYTRSIFLSDQFIKVFTNKNVYIMETFNSREEKDTQLDLIINEIFKNFNKYNKEEIINLLKYKQKQIIIYMGAGDIYKEIYNLKNNPDVNYS